MGSLGDANNFFIKYTIIWNNYSCAIIQMRHIRFALWYNHWVEEADRVKDIGMPKPDTRHLYKRGQ